MPPFQSHNDHETSISKFLDLEDTPTSLGSNDQVLTIKSGALAFSDAAGGGPTAVEWYVHVSRGGLTHSAYKENLDLAAVQTNIVASVNKLSDWDTSVGSNLIATSNVVINNIDGQALNTLNSDFANMDSGRNILKVVITHASASKIRNWLQFAYMGDSHPGKSLHGGGIATGRFFNNASGNSPVNGATSISEPSLIF